MTLVSMAAATAWREVAAPGSIGGACGLGSEEPQPMFTTGIPRLTGDHPDLLGRLWYE